jgi:hypothetical protein
MLRFRRGADLYGPLDGIRPSIVIPENPQTTIQAYIDGIKQSYLAPITNGGSLDTRVGGVVDELMAIIGQASGAQSVYTLDQLVDVVSNLQAMQQEINNINARATSAITQVSMIFEKAIKDKNNITNGMLAFRDLTLTMGQVKFYEDKARDESLPQEERDAYTSGAAHFRTQYASKKATLLTNLPFWGTLGVVAATGAEEGASSASSITNTSSGPTPTQGGGRKPNRRTTKKVRHGKKRV